MLDEVSQCVGDSMERDCINCGVDMTDCGVLVAIDEEFSISSVALCVDCLEQNEEDVLDIEDRISWLHQICCFFSVIKASSI